MSEKRWKVSEEMLDTIRLIQSNCQMCSNCSWCPFEYGHDYRLCFFGDHFPENWNLEEVEVESDG